MATTLGTTTFENWQHSFFEALRAQGIEYNRLVQLANLRWRQEFYRDYYRGRLALVVACLAWARILRTDG